MKNITLIIICLSLFASICVNIYQHHQNKKLTALVYGTHAGHESTGNGISGNKKGFQAKGDRTSSTGDGGINPKTGNAGTDDLAYQLNAAEEELDYTLRQLADAQKENDTGYDLQVDGYLRDSIDDEYDDLFRELGLSSGELQNLKDILFDNRMAQRDFYRELYGATPSEENRDRLKQLKKEINDEEERKITESLGNGVYERYKAYKDALDEINEVRSFAASLGSDNILTASQEKALIDAMQKEPIYSETDSDDAKIIFPSEIYTENNITEILSMHKGYNEAFVKASQGILSPSQLVLLKAYLNKRHDNYENSLKSMIRRYDRQPIENRDDNNTE